MNENTEMMQQAETDDWDDIDLSDLSDEAVNQDDDAEIEQPEAEASESPNEAEQPADQPEQAVEQPPQEEPEPAEQKADQLFELKHLDERREVTLEEMKMLAQKGMDYDRIREERDGMREGWEFLKEIAGDKTVQELIDETRAVRMAEQQGIDRSTALGRVKLDRERKAFEAQQQKANDAKAEQDRAAEAEKALKAAREKWQQDCFVAFSREFPDVNPDAIPKEVWTAFQNGETLVSAYRGLELRRLQQEMKTKQQAEDAAQRSTGSRQTAGSNEQDEFDRLWYDDD